MSGISSSGNVKRRKWGGIRVVLIRRRRFFRVQVHDALRIVHSKNDWMPGDFDILGDVGLCLLRYKLLSFLLIRSMQNVRTPCYEIGYVVAVIVVRVRVFF